MKSSIQKQVDIVFNEGAAWHSFHDTVFEVTGESLTINELKEIFMHLPVVISAIGVAWGLSDTVFNDEVYRFLEEQNKDVID